MDTRGSRKIEGEHNIKRPPTEDHIGTYFLPYERTVEAVPYYSKRKRELRGKNFLHKARVESDDPAELKEVEKEVEEELYNDLPLANYITDISIEPVFTDNKFTDFNAENYPLSEQEKVKVVEEKYFPLQNYYNYIWALKSKEEIFRLAEVTQQKANEVLEKQARRKGGKYVQALDDDSRNRPMIKETRKIKGVIESKVNSHGKNRSSQQYNPDLLSPVYVEYQDGKQDNKLFEVKEGKREKILNQFAAKYFL